MNALAPNTLMVVVPIVCLRGTDSQCGGRPARGSSDGGGGGNVDGGGFGRGGIHVRGGTGG